MHSPTQPALHNDQIPVPRGPLLAAALLLGVTMLAVALIRVSGVDISSRSQAPVVAERALWFEDAPDGSIRVMEAQRAGAAPVLLQVIAAGNGGFLRGALRALVRDRRLASLGPEAPFRLVAFADGRLSLEDPATRRRLDLESFGPSNSVVFAQLLAGPRPSAAAR